MDKFNNFIENLKQNDLTKINFSLLYDWKYLSDPNPSTVFIYEQWIYVIVLLNIIIGVFGFSFISRKFFEEKPKYKLIRKISFGWITNTIFLLLYNFMRVNSVRFLSARIVLVLILFVYIGIIIYSILYWFLSIPKKMQRFREAKLRDKYRK